MTVADSFDVAARLAEGRPAIDDLTEYVLACGRLGYQNQDLTNDPTQVRDWYDREAGLDLRALDADCAALARAAGAADEAARTHTDLVAELAGAWSGRGAAAAREFTWRSGQAAISVSSALRRAADAFATLRDELWRAIDAKVTAVQAIDARHRAQRADWLAAARTVTTGSGDLASASELIDQQVKPFVINDIGSEWLGAMRAAIVSINAAYDAAIASISSGPPAVFDVPGELGPRVDPSGTAVLAGGRQSSPSPVQTVPAASLTPGPSPAAQWSGVAPPGMSPAGWSPVGDPASSAPLTSPSAVPAGPMSPMPSSGEMGVGTSSLGSGLSGFGQQLADLIGGLVGSADGADATGIDEPTDQPDDDPLDEAADDDGEEPSTEGEPDAEKPEEGPAEEPDGEAAPEPTAVPPPPPPDPLPTAPPVPESAVETVARTPCEIAADELPQVGE